MTTKTEMKDSESAGSAELTRQTPDSIRQPAWHVAVLGLFSFGLYLVYWFYKTWRDLRNRALGLSSKDSQTPEAENPESRPGDSDSDVKKKKTKKARATTVQAEETETDSSNKIDREKEKRTLAGYQNCRPWLRTMAFFLPVILAPLSFTPLSAGAEMVLKFGWPILMVFLFANLFKDLASLIPDSKSWAGTNPIQAGFVLGLAVPFCLNLSGANGAAYLLYLLVVIPVGTAQNWINQYWEQLEIESGETRALRTAFSFKETLVIILGALWMGLVILDLLQVK